MCIIIDINVLGAVFEQQNLKHKNFHHVKDWILNNKGKIVYGGTGYMKELAKTKYLNVFTQFNKANKAVFVCSEIVDKETIYVSSLVSNKDFDDQHIVGLLRASGCKLICSLDERAFPFFRSSLFFSPASNKPKIYRSEKNKDLLCDKNIAMICKPCLKTTKQQLTLLKQ